MSFRIIRLTLSLACFLAGGLLVVDSIAQSAPSFLNGEFEDDYGIRYEINDDSWFQMPEARYRVDEWVPEDQYALLEGEPDITTESTASRMWLRIDWILLEDMAPYEWAFCITTWDALTKEEARSNNVADRSEPRTGCGGHPFSRMKRAQSPGWSERRVELQSGEWIIVGDEIRPKSAGPWPLVIMFNQAAGDRHPYQPMAEQLAELGIASIRVDLPGHGESTNLGSFVPGELRRDPLIWEADKHIISIMSQIRADTAFDSTRIVLVGASYSGEEMAEAGRIGGHVAAYVLLSPGSFGNESIEGIDSSGANWLYIASRQERFLIDITAGILATSESVEMMLLPGTKHATDILSEFPSIEGQIAIWIKSQFDLADNSMIQRD